MQLALLHQLVGDAAQRVAVVAHRVVGGDVGLAQDLGGHRALEVVGHHAHQGLAHRPGAGIGAVDDVVPDPLEALHDPLADGLLLVV